MQLKQFIYIVKPVKEDFLNTSTEEDNKIISEHFDHLKSLFEDRVLILAGPETNAKFGIVVFEAESEEKAREIMNNDPAVVKKVFSAELYPFRISLLRS
jgi:uncharacterized protein YciI